ncbi:MAG: hypothetical protein HP490_04255 [Nitrospira sp.]|nr:hypothetical protein [Nitrospira sp.]
MEVDIGHTRLSELFLQGSDLIPILISQYNLDTAHGLHGLTGGTYRSYSGIHEHNEKRAADQ